METSSSDTLGGKIWALFLNRRTDVSLLLRELTNQVQALVQRMKDDHVSQTYGYF